MGSKSQSQIVGIEFIGIFVAEKGGSRTLRGPYDPQTGFEDQRHHRAPSFSLGIQLAIMCRDSRKDTPTDARCSAFCGESNLLAIVSSVCLKTMTLARVTIGCAHRSKNGKISG